MSDVIGIGSRNHWRIRICTTPWQQCIHLLGQNSLPCIKAINNVKYDKSCPLCYRKTIRQTIILFMGAIDRTTNSYVVLKFGGNAFGAIRDLIAEVGNGPTLYDIDLTRPFAGMRWSALKVDQELSEADKAIIASIDPKELETLSKPTQADIERIEKIALLL